MHPDFQMKTKLHKRRELAIANPLQIIHYLKELSLQLFNLNIALIQIEKKNYYFVNF